MFDEFKKPLIYTIELGVLEDKSKRDAKSKGITNAEIMYIQEYGSPLRHIPRRPVLEMSIEHAKKTMLAQAEAKAMKAYLSSGYDRKELEKELNRFAMRLQSYARDIIYSNDGRLTPNAPSTIAAKGFDHPLFNTGQLARSITARVLNDKGEKV